jgi:antitoxin component YwqK of YwqJK toxin-antitoxin module
LNPFKYLFLAGIFLSLSSFGQMLNPPEGRMFEPQQIFNPRFIKNHKISEIRCEKERKRDGDRIRKTDITTVYHFYDDGLLKMIYQINHKIKDTSVTYYEYVGNRLNCEVKNDAAGMYSYCYVYGEDELPLSRKYGRASRFESITASVEPDRITEVTTERYEHKRIENQLHTTLFNSADRPYQKEIRYSDEHGYLIGYLKTFVMSSNSTREDYTYNEGGWLASKTIKVGDKETRLEYTYDEVGNMLTEDTFVNGKAGPHLEYVYYGEDMQVKAELIRDEDEAHILITTFYYTYR